MDWHEKIQTLMAGGAPKFNGILEQNDLKRRTGSWRVVQVLATPWIMLWAGGFFLVWLGFLSPSSVQIYIPMGIPFILAELVYLSIHELPKKKSLA